MGDLLPDEPLPAELDAAKVAAAVDAAFASPEGMTAAFVVTWKGRLIGEKYADGIDMHTSLESWSMGKSITSTLMGIMIQQGVYRLDQPAPVPEWQEEGDPRAQIRISDILRMSSGLRCRAPGRAGPRPLSRISRPPLPLYRRRQLVLLGRDPAAGVAAGNTSGTLPQLRPGSDQLSRTARRRGTRARSTCRFPRRALFDKIGIRNMVVEADPYGNFLLQGYELGSGRDWARLGNLYLQDGVWNGERILPEGYRDFVRTVAPAWAADGRPVYGGFFWINGTETFPIPKEAYYMAGAGGQYTIMIPTHDLVVVRLGHFKGASPGEEALSKSLALLMEAVPEG